MDAVSPVVINPILAEAPALLQRDAAASRRPSMEPLRPPASGARIADENQVGAMAHLSYGLPSRQLEILGGVRLLQGPPPLLGDAGPAPEGPGSSPEASLTPPPAEGETEQGEAPRAANANTSPAEQDEEKEQPAVAGPRGADGEPLSEEEMRQVDRLQQQDREIRAHERAHLAAAQGMARGGASFEYQVGPDGRRYAVGGEVQIDVAEGSTPEETARKMQVVAAAAMAPMNPSAQDRRVAAQARSRATEARLEAAMTRVESRRDGRAVQDGEMAERRDAAREDASPVREATSLAPEQEEVGQMDLIQPASPGPLGIAVETAGEGPPSALPGEDTAGVVQGRDLMRRVTDQARRAFGVRAYTGARQPGILQPEERAMQPGTPRATGITMVPTLEPPPGSLADALNG